MSTTSFADLGRIVVIIPTFNELSTLPVIVSRVRASVPEADILVADDNSPDGTGRLADELAAADDHVHVMHRLGKEGLGAAYLAGFAWALQAGYDVVVEMDADGSHQPEQLPRLLDALRTADLVLGSRWVPGGRTENWPKSRQLISRGGTAYTRLMLGVPIQDATGGYRAFRADTLRKLDLHEVASQGYCFQIDLAWRAVQRGLRVREVPITFVERTAGTSKMSRKIVAEALWRVTVWGVDDKVTRVRRRSHARRSKDAAVVTFRSRLLLFGYPLLEVLTAYAVGVWIGWGWMLLLLLVGIPIGFAIMRNAGDAAMVDLQRAAQSGQEPDAGRHGLAFLGGLLIMIPGFWTDLAGAAARAAADPAAPARAQPDLALLASGHGPDARRALPGRAT